MKDQGLKFLVIGAGAVGGITAAFLRRNNNNVTIVCKYDDYASLISQKGLEISGVRGEFTVKIPAFASVSQVTDEIDVIILATKATDLKDVVHSLNGILKKNGLLITLQNGICEDYVASVFDSDRIIGCVTGWGATMNSMGKLLMTSTGDFIIGYPYRKSDETLSGIAEILSSVVPVKTTDNIQGHKYSKLVINSCITSLGAICGLYLGKMLMIRKVRRIFIEIVREAVEVAERMNIKMEVFAGRLDFNKFIRGQSIYSDVRRHLILMVIGYKYKDLKSSSLQSLERGKTTEIDYLNGFITSNADRLGIQVPVNKYIVNMVHQIEENKREISLSNFNDSFFDRFS
jgi:2-dehydropantoate 2-reductase